VTQIFGGTQGQDNTDAILANGKVGIGYSRTSVPDAVLTFKSVRYPRYPMSTLITSFIGVSAKKAKKADITEDFTRFEPNTDPMPANGKVAIFTIKSVRYQVPNANCNIESYRHWLPSVTQYPRLS